MTETQADKTAVSRAKTRHRKLPGFNAYNSHPKVIEPPKTMRKGRKKKSKKGKKVYALCEEIIDPVTGIHSKEWASKIAKQKIGFCRLPHEIRCEIYKLVIADMNIGHFYDGDGSIEEEITNEFWSRFLVTGNRIAPYKDGKKFWALGWPTKEADTHRLLLICRQSYLDVAGGALFYQLNSFAFASTNLMLNYLLVIKPFHRHSITTIALNYTLTPSKKGLDNKILRTLAECKGLRHLSIQIDMCFRDLELILRLQNPIPGRGFESYYFQMPDKYLAKVRDSEPLRELAGLISFNLGFSCQPTNNSRYELAPDAEEKYRSVEEELRLAIVKNYKGNSAIQSIKF